MGRRQKTPGPGAYDVPKHLVIGSPDPTLQRELEKKRNPRLPGFGSSAARDPDDD